MLKLISFQALLEKDKNKSGTETTALQGQISELKVKLENANKNLETQRATARETEVCKLFTVLYLLSHFV